MSMKMMKLLPYMMKKQGISLVAERVFIEERYFVLQLQIQHVDVKKLAQGQMQKSDDSGDSEPDIEAIEKEIEEEEEEVAGVAGEVICQLSAGSSHSMVLEKNEGSVFTFGKG